MIIYRYCGVGGVSGVSGVVSYLTETLKHKQIKHSSDKNLIRRSLASRCSLTVIVPMHAFYAEAPK